MNVVYWLFAIGNVILFFGTCLLIKGLLKNRKTLSDFDPLGSLLTFIPCAMFSVNFFMMHNWISFWFGLVTVTVWAMATFFSMKNKIKEYIDDRVPNV